MLRDLVADGKVTTDTTALLKKARQAAAQPLVVDISHTGPLVLLPFQRDAV